LFREIDRIICVADSVKEDVLRSNWRLPAEKAAVLENSVDYDRFAGVSISKADARQTLGLPSDAFVFGTIARFGPFKGHNFLVSAFEKVKTEVPSAHLVLVGEGPFKQDIRQQAAAAGMAQSVHFLGQRNDIPGLLRAIDCFVLPSVGSEGMPRVLLEAMAASVPCIGTTVGGTPEVLCSSDVGYLVPPRDADALAEAMIALAKIPEQKLKGLVERARERIRMHFSHEVVAKRLGSIYEVEIGRRCESNRRQTSST
jgi:glycosyltransferase involved in cell wall biosynthesis